MQANRVTVDRKALLDPSDAAWSGAPAQVLQLVRAPLTMQPSPWMQGAFQDLTWGDLVRAELRLVHNGEVLAARVSWAVPVSAERSLGANEFPDACAVMFPFVRDASIFMGAENAWVNMWLWRADGHGPFAVTAAGIGTSQRVDDGVLEAAGAYRDGTWEVVLTRALDPGNGRDHVPLRPGARWQVSLALWHGARAERAGIKSFSPTWTELEIAG